MATAIKDFDLSGQTVRYGGVQFGGGGPMLTGTPVKTTPPKFSFRSEVRYDDAGRTALAHRCTLDVMTVAFSDTVAIQEAQLRKIRRELLTPRLSLLLAGVGLGFDTVQPSTDWGPKPISCVITMYGKQTAEITWSVQFEVATCDTNQAIFSDNLKALNYSQAFGLDDEGFLSIITSGYWEIAPQLATGGQISDQFRERINVAVPKGFRRIQQNYQESTDRTRTDFQISDSQLRGDAPPPHMTRANGTFSIGVQNRNFSQGQMTLSAVLTTAPGVPPSLSVTTFFLMANQKIEDIRTSTGGEMTIVPLSLYIERGLWEDSRTTRITAGWVITSCISEFLQTGFWAPLPNSDYDAWYQSISHLWHQRGVAKLESDPASDFQVNLCNPTSQVIINTKVSETEEDDEPADSDGILCGNIDPKYSWLDYKVSVQFMREENIQWHRLAADAARTVTGSVGSIIGAGGLKLPTQFDSTGIEDVPEQTGTPTTLILLKARGMRMQHKPVFPVITEIGGQPVTIVRQNIEIGPMFNAGCVVYKMRGWILYRVTANIEEIDADLPNPTVCGTKNPGTEGESERIAPS